MNAQIFYLKSQNPKFDQTKHYHSIARLLRKHVFSDIDIKVKKIEIDKMYSEGRGFGELYLRQLKASIISVGDFSIVVKNDNETAWSYLDREKNAHSDSFLEVKQSRIASLFPAVAIMDRMVMLPEGITTGLDKHPREFLWCLKPLDLGGVMLVDFDDEKSLQEAIRQLGVWLKIEVKKLCGSYMAMHRIMRPDFEDLSKLLHIDANFLKPLENELLFTKLSSSIVSKPAVVGKSSQVILEIRNESNDSLNQVRVRVRAPADTLPPDLPVSRILDLPKGGAARIDFQVSPQISPYCPLEVIVDLNDNKGLKPFPMPVILDVLPKDENR